MLANGKIVSVDYTYKKLKEYIDLLKSKFNNLHDPTTLTLEGDDPNYSTNAVTKTKFRIHYPKKDIKLG